MKIAFFNMQKYTDDSQDFIKKKLKNDKVTFFHDALSEKLVKKVKDYDIICISPFTKVNKEFVDSFSNLKLIATMSTGFDHIDLDECKKLGIRVCSVPVYGENRIAEYALALILGMSTKLYDSVNRTKHTLYFQNDAGLRGFDLYGKTVGLIGCGNIGANVAKMLHAIEMKVIVYDIKPNPKLAKKYGFEYVTLNKLLKTSDIISVHVPYSKYTHHLVGKDMFDKMKEGVCFVNTARGAVVDTLELVKALKSKKIKSAALDVMENEFDFCPGIELSKERMRVFKANIELMKMKNVLVTPHNGSNSVESLHKIVETTVENIMNFKRKKKSNVVV